MASLRIRHEWHRWSVENQALEVACCDLHKGPLPRSCGTAYERLAKISHGPLATFSHLAGIVDFKDFSVAESPLEKLYFINTTEQILAGPVASNQ